MDTKQELFALLQKYYNTPNDALKRVLIGAVSKLTHKQNPYITKTEFNRLIEILTLENPYISTPKTELAISQLYKKNGIFKVKNISDSAQYEPDNRLININQTYVNSLFNGKHSIGDLFDTIGHEQRHHAQYKPLDINSTPQLKLANDVIKEFNDYRPTKEDFKEFYEYVEKQDSKPLKRFLDKTFGADNRNNKIATVQFGGYLQQLFEIDARKAGQVFANTMFSSLISDPECPKPLLDILIDEESSYMDDVTQINFEYSENMKYFELFKTKLKNAMDKVLLKHPDEAKPSEISILERCVGLLTRSLSIHDRILYFDWAIKNNHLAVAQNTVLASPDLNEEERDICTKYLDVLNKTNQITTENCDAYCKNLAVIAYDKQLATNLICQHIEQGKIAIAYKEIYNLQFSVDHTKIAETLLDYANNFRTQLENQDMNTPIFNNGHLYNCIAFYATEPIRINMQLCNDLKTFYDWEYNNHHLVDSIQEEQYELAEKLLYLDIYGEKQFIVHYNQEEYDKIQAINNSYTL